MRLPRRPLLLVAACAAAGAAALAGWSLQHRDDPVQATQSSTATTGVRAALVDCTRRAVDSEDATDCQMKAVARAGKVYGMGCHDALHADGRAVVRRLDLRARDLAAALPPMPDSDCGAGFAHGLIMGVAGTLGSARDARAFAKTCDDSATLAARQACVHGLGHAFMRAGGGEVEQSLLMCASLEGGAASSCASGVFHDAWLGVARADDAPAPSVALDCVALPDRFAEPCWYRRAAARPAGSGDAARREGCDGIGRVQEAACTLAWATSSAREHAADDPTSGARATLRECRSLARAAALACARGVALAVATGRNSGSGATLRTCELATSQLELAAACVEQLAWLLAIRDATSRAVPSAGSCRALGAPLRPACRRGWSSAIRPATLP